MQKSLSIYNQRPDIFNGTEDPRSAEGLINVFEGADFLIKQVNGDISILLEMEKATAVESDKYSVIFHLTIKAAISKLQILNLRQPVHLDITVPMFHEKRRMSPRQGSKLSLGVNALPVDEHGEDELLRKHHEMQWLTNGSLATYTLRFVDDLCDENSGEVASKIIQNNNLTNCEVHWLDRNLCDNEISAFKKQAIRTIIDRQSHPPKESDSIKGGALCLGFAEAVEAMNSREDTATFIGYVDADSSYSLTQLGIPLGILISTNSVIATASRQHELTIMGAKSEHSQTSKRTTGLIRLKQTVGYLRRFVVGNRVPTDTQSGFKLANADVLREVISRDNKAHNFSFDTQLLARISQMYPGIDPIHTFGVVCIDSDELSTANNGVTYLEAANTIKDIAKEFGFNMDGDEMWLLEFMTKSKENFLLMKEILEDSRDSADWFSPGSLEFELLNEVKYSIRTDYDTTAVGEYYDQELFGKLVFVLKAVENKIKEV